MPNFGIGSDATTLAGRFTNQQILGPNGQVILANAQPGSTGDTALNMPQARGPGLLAFNGSGQKIFQVKEKYKITLRADVLNLLNKPQWGNPTTNINSTSFGRITTATGSRVVVLNGRFDFRKVQQPAPLRATQGFEDAVDGGLQPARGFSLASPAGLKSRAD